MALDLPNLRQGIGLRPRHYAQMLEAPPPVGWLEVISENFFAKGGRPLHVLDKVRRDVPVVLHGVAMSIGTTDPLSGAYLKSLRTLIDRVEPAWVSDHLCFGSHRGQHVHDLLPLPYTEESLVHVVERVEQVQDVLGRRILLENPSSYVAFAASTLTEWEFLAEVAQRADCGVLLDVNNVFVSARNHGFDALEYLEGIPLSRVGQFHLAGHSDHGGYLLDTHDHPVPEGVWALYREAVKRFPNTSTLIEWDDNVPPFDVLVAETRRAAAIEDEVRRGVAA